jgi:hypothetical protein
MVKIHRGRTKTIYEIDADKKGIDEITNEINLWRGRKLKVTIDLRRPPS